jgi:hypothetical protein
MGGGRKARIEPVAAPAQSSYLNYRFIYELYAKIKKTLNLARGERTGAVQPVAVLVNQVANSLAVS